MIRSLKHHLGRRSLRRTLIYAPESSGFFVVPPPYAGGRPHHDRWPLQEYSSQPPHFLRHVRTECSKCLGHGHVIGSATGPFHRRVEATAPCANLGAASAATSRPVLYQGLKLKTRRHQTKTQLKMFYFCGFCLICVRRGSSVFRVRSPYDVAPSRSCGVVRCRVRCRFVRRVFSIFSNQT